MYESYFSAGAPTGQTQAQAPQLMQVPSSITYLPSPAEIAETGHSASQAPQLMHSSEITYAILHPPPIILKILYHVLQKNQPFPAIFL